MNQNCPICHSSLIREDSLPEIVDLLCCQDDHFFGQRFNKENLIILKIRLKDDDKNLFVRLNYELNSCNIWIKADQIKPITLSHIIHLDYSNIDKLKQKIKTLLLFS